jgi:hypothetical protein
MIEGHAPCLFVFAKGPRLGAGKTRLAGGLGQVEALRVNRFLQARGLRAALDPRWRVVLMAARRADLTGAFPGVWPGLDRCGRALQRSGGLGERLAAVFERDGPTAVMGLDCPAVTAAAIAQGWRALRRAPFSIGPAEDGGFWFFAARRGWDAVQALRGPVRWSSAHAGADLLAGLPGRAARIRTLADVDELPDWRAFQARQRAARSSSGARPEASASNSGAVSPALWRQRA